MREVTLYAQASIHTRPNIICAPEHSCHIQHYMAQYTFMNQLTLYARLNIHDLAYIACEAVHSCFHLHYMRKRTFI